MNPMIKRMEAAQACIDRFSGKPYEPGKRDGVQMARHLLHHLGRRVGQGKLPTYTSEKRGIVALRRMGFSTLIEAMDSFNLPRIAPAAALAGDIVAMESLCPLGDLAIAVGNGRLLGYLDGHEGAVVYTPHQFLAAWRTI